MDTGLVLNLALVDRGGSLVRANMFEQLMPLLCSSKRSEPVVTLLCMYYSSDSWSVDLETCHHISGMLYPSVVMQWPAVGTEKRARRCCTRDSALDDNSTDIQTCARLTA